jgi:hypothetical protein
LSKIEHAIKSFERECRHITRHFLDVRWTGANDTGDRVAAGAGAAWFGFDGGPMRGQQKMYQPMNGCAAALRGSSGGIQITPSGAPQFF